MLKKHLKTVVLLSIFVELYVYIYIYLSICIRYKGISRDVNIRKTLLFSRGHNDMVTVLQDRISLSSHTLQWQFEEAPCLH